jgi:hypothetical protein
LGAQEESSSLKQASPVEFVIYSYCCGPGLAAKVVGIVRVLRKMVSLLKGATIRKDGQRSNSRRHQRDDPQLQLDAVD